MVIAGWGDISRGGGSGSAAVDGKPAADTRERLPLSRGSTTRVMGDLPHARSNESEADRMGIIYPAIDVYDIRTAIVFWQKIARLASSEILLTGVAASRRILSPGSGRHGRFLR